MQGTLSAAERSMRSVFVGNIPYEATEEQLKDIFSEVGPVVSFRLVYDRETGKPKGYGFCEYKDQEMALSAMRNLNGYELNGRALRVDNAASEKSKEELKNLQASLGGPPVESPYGPEVPPDKAPEAVSKVVASLPPEQMYELMKEMKTCIQNNPNEARNLLLQNPQLAYALLQSQVVMRMLDPSVAVRMLHRQNPNAAVALLPTPESESAQSVVPPASKISNTPAMPTSLPYHQPAVPMISDVSNNPTLPPVNSTAPGSAQPVSNLVTSAGTRGALIPPPRPSLLGDRPQPVGLAEPPRLTGPPIPPMNQYPERVAENFEPYNEHRSHSDLDMRQAPRADHDMRQTVVRQPSSMLSDQDMRQSMADQDLRMMAPSQGMIDNRPFDPRFRPVPLGDPSGRPGMGTTSYERQRGAPQFDPRSAYDNRHAVASGPLQLEDPRSAQIGMGAASRMPVGNRMTAATASPVVPQSSPISGSSPPRPSSSLAAAAAAIAPHDQEKAALIMQVLQLSDQQIAMLPPEQRQSIMILKEQIARSGPH